MNRSEIPLVRPLLSASTLRTLATLLAFVAVSMLALVGAATVAAGS